MFFQRCIALMSSVDDGSDYPSGSDEELGGDEVTGINVDVTGNLTEDDERELTQGFCYAVSI